MTLSRRRRWRIAQITAAALLVAAVVVVLIVRSQRAEFRVTDLSAIGTGVPAVVQIHDVTCPICTRLRANAKRIDQRYDDNTSLVLDGDGNLIHSTHGILELDSLRTRFDAHGEAY